MDNLRSSIATKILSNIPPRVRPIEYLMKSLEISRESVYRRIRGDISFSLEEIAKLSVELGFSIDELVMKDVHSRVFFDLHINCDQNPSDVYINMFEQYFKSLFEVSSAKGIDSMMIVNHIPPGFLIFYNHLFKFSYYKWMHQNQESSLNYYYADITLPEKLLLLKQKALDNIKKFRNNTFIYDTNIFRNLIADVQYYYKRKLINENELLLIKDDLLSMMDLSESITQTGYYGHESKYSFYLSSLNIDSSSRIIKFDDHLQSQFFINSIKTLTISNPSLCSMHKKWLESMRKYSTLITQSNEILQVKYFHKQRAYIEGIKDILLI